LQSLLLLSLHFQKGFVLVLNGFQDALLVLQLILQLDDSKGLDLGQDDGRC
jgi:hypothetical protein